MNTRTTRKYTKPQTKIIHAEHHILASLSQDTNGTLPVIDDPTVELDAPVYRHSIWEE